MLWFRITVLVPLLALLGACSGVRVTYDNADWLLARMAQSYVDLDADQDRALKAGLAQFHHWHRREELPRYAQLFDEAARRIERGLSRADVEWAVMAVRGRSQVLARRAAPDLAPLLLSLNDRQLDELEESFARSNRKFYAAKLPNDPEAAIEARAEWLNDQLAVWTGSLSTAQRRRVEQLVRAFPEFPALRLDNREKRQAELLRLLRQRDDPAVQSRLIAFLSNPEASRTERYHTTLVAWESQFIDLLVDLDRGLSPRQRAAAVRRLHGYAAEFRGLAHEAVATAGS